MKTCHEDLERGVAFYGHLCSGQIIGVRRNGGYYRKKERVQI